jgi:hypothetical protein
MTGKKIGILKAKMRRNVPMSSFYTLMINEINGMKKIRRNYMRELESLPEGSLVRKRVKGRVYYYHSVKGEKIYLSLKNREGLDLALKLRRKKFLEKVIPILEKDINVLTKAVKRYIPIEPIKISKELAEAYRLLPGREPEVPWFFPEKAANVTFRSKSEQIEALVYESRGIRVQHEREIVIKGVPYHPDFTFVLKDFGMFFHEHMGMMDKRGYYRRSVVERLMDFWDHGIRLGKNLILTFEDEEHPLCIATVNQVLDMFFANLNIAEEDVAGE